MSTWGGIGEGIAQGLKERMDREDQERRERTAQFNANRQFAFQKEQAERAQANSDRTFEAGREDAERAQSNADRVFAEGVRRADMAQANADRTFAANQEQRGIENQRADYELELKGEAQDWSNRINAEKLREFQLANEKLDAEMRKRQEREQLSQETAAKQWVFATARMLRGTSGREEEWNMPSDQGPTMLKGRIVDGDEFYSMFGKDSDLVKQGYYGIAMTEDENGKPMFTLLNNDPKMNIVKNEDAMYDTYNGEYPGLGDEYFREAKKDRDLGVLAQTKKIETDEGIRRDEARAVAGANAYNLRNRNSTGYAFGERLALQLARNPDKAEEIAEYLGVPQEALIEIFRNTLGAYGGGAGGGGAAGAGGGAGGGDRRVKLPSSAYKRVGFGRYSDGAIQLKSGERVAKGKSLKTPAGTIVNEGDGNVYIIPVSE